MFSLEVMPSFSMRVYAAVSAIAADSLQEVCDGLARRWRSPRRNCPPGQFFDFFTKNKEVNKVFISLYLPFKIVACVGYISRAHSL